jgi:predicted AAA+ superfamily ATPase
LPKTLERACTPRPSVFAPSVRHTVYSLDDLATIDPGRFFAETYVTDGMRLQLTDAFTRL